MMSFVKNGTSDEIHFLKCLSNPVKQLHPRYKFHKNKGLKMEKSTKKGIF